MFCDNEGVSDAAPHLILGTPPTLPDNPGLVILSSGTWAQIKAAYNWYAAALESNAVTLADHTAKLEKLMTQQERLTSDVQTETADVQSLTTMVQQNTQVIADLRAAVASNDMAAVAAAADQIEQNHTALQQALGGIQSADSPTPPTPTPPTP